MEKAIYDKSIDVLIGGEILSFAPSPVIVSFAILPFVSDCHLLNDPSPGYDEYLKKLADAADKYLHAI